MVADAGPLRLLGIVPAPGSQVSTPLTLRLEFDRPLDPRTLAQAVTFEYPDPGVTLLASPFRHVGIRLEREGRVLVAEPPELLVGRELVARVSPALRGADGSAPASDLPSTLGYRVLELPP